MARDVNDVRYMQAAIRLSRWHLGQTSSNPSVGCLIVRDGAIVGRGVTAVSGRPHAETEALRDAGEKARGATAYVSLEPCSHFGHTPPCANALIASGVARVVVALGDPDARVAGRGISMLEEAGVEVEVGIARDQAHEELEAYLNRQTKKRPQVILKLAVSRDGMIGRTGEGQLAITGRLARAQSHILRAESDAILVGIGTVLADDPELTCRLPGLENRSPTRIVLDNGLRIPLSSRLVQTCRKVPLVVVTNDERMLDSPKARELSEAGAEVLAAAGLETLLSRLGSRGVSSLIVEGGAQTARAFLSVDLVDRIVLFRGTTQIGENGIASPVVEQSVSAGFVERRREILGEDRVTDYIRADTGSGS